MSSIRVALNILPHAESLPRPSYATASSAGIDLAAAVSGDIALAPGERRAVPTGKQGEPWDVAYAALFLASDESKYVNATELVVDGGLTGATPGPPQSKEV